jgi:hypothetical protein
MNSKILFTVVSFHSLILFFLASVVLLRSSPRFWLHLLTMFLGFLIGLLSLTTSEPQVVVFLLIVFGFFAGFLALRRPWIFGFLLAGWIPFLLIVALLAGFIRGQAHIIPGSFLFFIPASFGIGLGVFIRGKNKSDFASLSTQPTDTQV